MAIGRQAGEPTQGRQQRTAAGCMPPTAAGDLPVHPNPPLLSCRTHLGVELNDGPHRDGLLEGDVAHGEGLGVAARVQRGSGCKVGRAWTAWCVKRRRTSADSCCATQACLQPKHCMLQALKERSSARAHRMRPHRRSSGSDKGTARSGLHVSGRVKTEWTGIRRPQLQTHGSATAPTALKSPLPSSASRARRRWRW